MDKSTATQNSTAKGAYKRLLKELLPYGMVATKKWLMAQGLSRHAVDNGVKTGTLLPLATGIYSQYSPAVSWAGVVASLQLMQKGKDLRVPPIVVGGLSALALSGVAHYVPLSDKQRINLYSNNKLPSWLGRLSLPMDFEQHSTRQLWPDEVSADETFVKKHVWQPELPPVYFSCPEKAILEVMMDLPQDVSFEHVDELMQGLTNLSPRRLDSLLQACKSVKVKRLFFWFAKRQSYPWFCHLSANDYDLGSGKRVIAQGGRLDADYLITVPSEMVPASDG